VLTAWDLTEVHTPRATSREENTESSRPHAG
jgi:hypothetical protein